MQLSALAAELFCACTQPHSPKVSWKRVLSAILGRGLPFHTVEDRASLASDGNLYNAGPCHTHPVTTLPLLTQGGGSLSMPVVKLYPSPQHICTGLLLWFKVHTTHARLPCLGQLAAAQEDWKGVAAGIGVARLQDLDAAVGEGVQAVWAPVAIERAAVIPHAVEAQHLVACTLASSLATARLRAACLSGMLTHAPRGGHALSGAVAVKASLMSCTRT